MWGRAIECGVLENPWTSPPEEPFTLTRNAKDAPAEPRDIVVGFEAGVPVSLDGEPTDLVTLIDELGTAVGSYGWGRIDMVENRRVGIKSREVYECPAPSRSCSRTRISKASRSNATSRARSSGSRSESPS